MDKKGEKGIPYSRQYKGELFIAIAINELKLTVSYFKLDFSY